MRLICFILLSTLGIFVCVSANQLLAATITLTSERDNSIFSETQSNANGAGHNIYTGRGGGGGGGGSGGAPALRRGLLAFDIAASVPTGATIQNARLTLHLIDAATNGPAFVDVNLHRVLADWGEGLSDAGEGNGTGTGTAALTNDVTWNERFFNSAPATPWSTVGGEFAGTSSAAGHSVTNPTNTIGQLNTPATDFYFWESTGSGGMVDDLQLWLDNPGSNFGWILVGDESQIRTTRRFHTREDDDPTYRPALRIEYTLGSESLASVPEPGSLLLCGMGLWPLYRQRRKRRQ